MLTNVFRSGGGRKWQSISEAEIWATTYSYRMPFTLRYAIEFRDDISISQNEEEYDSTTAKPTFTFIGTVGAGAYIPQIGYMLHPVYQGQGLATEALTYFLPIFFECVPDMDYCEAWVIEDNLKSIRVLKKCGFQPQKLKPPRKCSENETGLAEFHLEDDVDENLRWDEYASEQLRLDEDVDKQLRLAIEAMKLNGGHAQLSGKPVRNLMVRYELSKKRFTTERAGQVRS
jgi:RimJ/RimL family protein N-acetyltransferase